jgi:hypothetical protein
VAAAAIVLAACSGGDGGGGGRSCVLVACGGDVVGDWTVGSVCFGQQAPEDECDSTTDLSDTEVDGTFSFDADMTYTSAISIRYCVDGDELTMSSRPFDDDVTMVLTLSRSR